MAFAETQKLLVKLDLEGNLQAKLGSAARALQGFDRATSNTQRSLSKFGRNIERGIVVGTGAAVAGFVAVAKAAGDFEAQMNTIATIVDRKDIPAIGEQLRKTARDTGLSLDDLSQAYYDLASAGVTGKLASEALNDAVKLGIGGLATTAETVDLLTTAINAYQLDAKGAAKATDQFALAVKDGKVTASQIAASFADVASIAKQTGIGIDQIAASYAYLTAQGVPATEVTTEMQRAIISLLSPTKDLEKAGKALGVSWEQEIRKKGLVPALQEIATYAAKNKIPLIDLFGRIEAVKYTLQTTGGNLKGFEAELAAMGKASGVAAEQMSERQQGLNFQLSRLKALVRDAGITIGSALLPKLVPLVEKLNTFISGNQDKIAKFGTDLANGFQKLADAVQKVDWQPFIDGLKLSGDIAKTVISAFRSLPEDLQKLVVAGFALNKVTGGLGTSIVKDIGGAIIGNLAARGATPSNPLFVVDISGGAAGKVAGAAGGLGKGLGLVGKVFLVGAAVGVFAELKGIFDQQSKANRAQEADLSKQTQGFTKVAGIADMQRSLDGILAQEQYLNNTWDPAGFAYRLNIDGVRDSIDAQKKTLQDAIAAAADQATLDARRVEAAENRGVVKTVAALSGKERDDRAIVKATLSVISNEFKNIASALKTGPASQIKNAIAEAMKLIGGGRGDATNTGNVLAGLKAALKRTHDPELQRELKAAIGKVEHVLPGRQFAAKQLQKADAVLRSQEKTGQKVKDLQSIERSLRDRGLPHAADRIRAKIDQAKRETVYAQHAATQAIKDKDLSVSLRQTINNQVTVRSIINGTALVSTYGHTLSTKGGFVIS